MVKYLQYCYCKHVNGGAKCSTLVYRKLNNFSSRVDKIKVSSGYMYRGFSNIYIKAFFVENIKSLIIVLREKGKNHKKLENQQFLN